jgi:hypothetical protein
MRNRITTLIAVGVVLVGTVSSALAAVVPFEFTWRSTWADASEVRDYTTVNTVPCGPDNPCFQWAEINGYMLVDTDHFLLKAPDYTTYSLPNSNAILGLFLNVIDYRINWNSKEKQLLEAENYGLPDFKQLTFSTGGDQLDFSINLCGQVMQPDPLENHNFCSPTGHVGAFSLLANNLDADGNPTQAPSQSWAYEMKTRSGTEVILTSMMLVPEPSSVLLLVCGMVCLFITRRLRSLGWGRS